MSFNANIENSKQKYFTDRFCQTIGIHNARNKTQLNALQLQNIYSYFSK